MADPPHGQKEHQQQAIQMGAILDPTGFDVPASTFAILKSGFHPHAPSIFLDASRTGLFIADENPRLLIGLLPRDAHPGFRRPTMCLWSSSHVVLAGITAQASGKTRECSSKPIYTMVSSS